MQGCSEKGMSFIIVNSFASRGRYTHEVVVVIGSSPPKVVIPIMYVCMKGYGVAEVTCIQLVPAWVVMNRGEYLNDTVTS